MSRLKTVEFYDEQNAICARLILGNVAKYGGPDSLMVVWAKSFVSRIEAPPADSECGPLFSGKAA
jgi:hypothetical protein